MENWGNWSSTEYINWCIQCVYQKSKSQSQNEPEQKRKRKIENIYIVGVLIVYTREFCSSVSFCTLGTELMTINKAVTYALSTFCAFTHPSENETLFREFMVLFWFLFLAPHAIWGMGTFSYYHHQQPSSATFVDKLLIWNTQLIS